MKFLFFFQAEDGIRDYKVTGVQTCALPIFRQGCCENNPGKHPLHDLHFKVEGPVITHMQETFADDWEFCTDERLTGDAWFPAVEQIGSCLARGIEDGPDVEYDKIRLTILGAIGCATRSLNIITPYFLPDQALITALNVAAMRGVDVKIIVPQKNNLRLVQWACTAQLWQVLQRGCKVRSEERRVGKGCGRRGGREREETAGAEGVAWRVD